MALLWGSACPQASWTWCGIPDGTTGGAGAGPAAGGGGGGGGGGASGGGERRPGVYVIVTVPRGGRSE